MSLPSGFAQSAECPKTGSYAFKEHRLMVGRTHWFGSGCCGLVFSLTISGSLMSQQRELTLELSSEQKNLVVLSSDEEPSDSAISVSIQPLPIPIARSSPRPIDESIETELVEQMYPSGKPHIARQVALDSQGNYVNHGLYQEWTESGDLKVHGTFDMGKQHGTWVRYCTARESKLFESEPFSKFKAPFQSTAEFGSGALEGFWFITDKDGNRVMEIQLVEGNRQGSAVWYHPNGKVLWQSNYDKGFLHGDFVELDASGKTVRQTTFVHGQKSDSIREFHANKKLKAEYQVLSPKQTLASADDWSRSQLATYQTSGSPIKHGNFTSYYESGAVQSKATFKNGIQEGEFTSWHSSGQKEASGNYLDGKLHGKWQWWHTNGMPQAVANYQKGQVTGEILAWNEQGTKVRPDAALPVQATAESTKVAESKAAASKTDERSSRSAAVPRRPGNK
jgi:antitoxin component YwqK of YwqJK toxin-antitoxin module